MVIQWTSPPTSLRRYALDGQVAASIHYWRGHFRPWSPGSGTGACPRASSPHHYSKFRKRGTQMLVDQSRDGDNDLYWDPFDEEIDVDPYPVWHRIQEEAPLYRNDV